MMFPAIRCALDSLEAPESQARIACRVRLGRTCRAGAAEFHPGAALADVLELWDVQDAVRRQLEEEAEKEQADAALGLALWASIGAGDSD